jgi:hypothetical protein
MLYIETMTRPVQPLGPPIPEWIMAEYYANGPLPYILRLMRTYIDQSLYAGSALERAHAHTPAQSSS